MSKEKIRLVDYMKGDTKNFTKDAKKLNKKTPKNQFMNSGSKFPAAYSGVHESLIKEMISAATPGMLGSAVTTAVASNAPFDAKDEERKSDRANNRRAKRHDGYEEDEEKQGASKLEKARQLFRSIHTQPNITRDDIVAKFEQQLGLLHSTAASYYDRISKEMGWHEGEKEKEEGEGRGDKQVEPEKGHELDDIDGKAVDELPADTHLDLEDVVDDPENDRQGVIRTVDDAHLVFKRQDAEGRYEELWIFNVEGKMGGDLKIRKDILAGTDIPSKKTASPDGTQKYSLTTLGNAQLLHIEGLPN